MCNPSRSQGRGISRLLAGGTESPRALPLYIVVEPRGAGRCSAEEAYFPVSVILAADK